MLEVVERETGAAPQWAVIWLHGLGANANDFVPILPELVRPQWPSIRFVFPNAPVIPITINNGARTRGWYDIAAMDFPRRGDIPGVMRSVAELETLIQREHERGIPAERLLLAGFSQGGAVALSAGLRREQPLAGLIALSTYLPDPDSAGQGMAPSAAAQPVFVAHGQMDPVIPLPYAELSAKTLESLGFAVDWHSYPMAHQVCAEEIRDLGDWLQRRFDPS